MYPVHAEREREREKERERERERENGALLFQCCVVASLLPGQLNQDFVVETDPSKEREKRVSSPFSGQKE